MKRSIFSIFLFICIFTSLTAQAVERNNGKELLSKMLPSPLLLLDNHFSHHVLIAEKSTHQLHLYRTNKSYPEYVKTYNIATGKKAGNKLFQGDYRTPEGIYKLGSFLTHDELIERYGKAGEIYGAGAFVLNYPNPIDLAQGKTGGGIWIHSTNDETRIEKGLDSRGCIVLKNDDLKDLSRYIELNRTSIVIVQDLPFLKNQNWKKYRTTLKELIDKWINSWQTEDLETYLGFYHPQDYRDNSRKNYAHFKNYKKAVFNNPGKPTVKASNVSILQTGNYALVTFNQFYKSNTIEDTGRKTLYLKKDKFYNWKIVTESWEKTAPVTEHATFRPSMRFFKISQKEQVNASDNDKPVF